VDEVEQAVVSALQRSRTAAVVVLDRDAAIRSWNDGAELILGWPAAEVTGRSWPLPEAFPDPVRRRQAAAEAAAVLAGSSRSQEWTLRRADGELARVHVVHEPVLGAAGEVTGSVLVGFDQSRRARWEQALVRQALQDGLTGLPGRSMLLQALTGVLADRRRPNAAAVLFCDLDNFKEVNDRFGHEAGDRVLVEVARRLRAAVRGDDLVARFGGDEFLVLVPLQGSSQLAVEVADRVAAALARPIELPEGSIEVAASIGVAIADPTDDPDEVLRRADAAMYRAKRSLRDDLSGDPTGTRSAIAH
jgi:diguanylate cyclase (GGDEF)-like protein/PAS domain S-box-containing protein